MVYRGKTVSLLTTLVTFAQHLLSNRTVVNYAVGNGLCHGSFRGTKLTDLSPGWRHSVRGSASIRLSVPRNASNGYRRGSIPRDATVNAVIALPSRLTARGVTE